MFKAYQIYYLLKKLKILLREFYIILCSYKYDIFYVSFFFFTNIVIWNEKQNGTLDKYARGKLIRYLLLLLLFNIIDNLFICAGKLHD